MRCRSSSAASGPQPFRWSPPRPSPPTRAWAAWAYLIDGIKIRQFHIALVGALLVTLLALVLDGLLAAAVWVSAPGQADFVAFRVH